MNQITALFLSFILFSSQYVYGQYYGVSDPVEASWSIGLQLGISQVQGDVKPEGIGYHGGLMAQKVLSRAVDLRLQFQAGQAQGMDLESSQHFALNTALNGAIDSVHFYDSADVVYHNFQMKYLDLSALFKINLNRLFGPTGGESWDLYALAGIGVQLYQTHVNAKDEGAGAVYDFNSIGGSEPTEVLSQLQGILDNTYETRAQIDALNGSFVSEYAVNTMFVTGGGVRIKVSPSISTGLEARYIFVGDDLLDGQQWTVANELSPDRDKLLTLSLFADYTF